MADNSQINKIYSFLASFGANNAWIEKADGYNGNNKDGKIIKAEFRSFLQGEYSNWSGEESGLSLDIINKFWKEIDSNVSGKISGTNLNNLNALDDKEAEELSNQVEYFVNFENYCSALKAPSVLKSAGAWLKDVKAELKEVFETWLANGHKGELNDILDAARPAIERKYTAVYCASEYIENLKSSILKGYSNYDIKKDDAAMQLIENYVANIASSEETKTPDDIYNEVRQVVNAYLQTAGIGESDYDLTQLGYAPDKDYPLNGIQKAVLTKTVTDNLQAGAAKINDYEELKDEYLKGINDFVEELVSNASYGDFETLKNTSFRDFIQSIYYTKIHAAEDIKDRYFSENAADNTEFVDALKKELGESTAKGIIESFGWTGTAYEEVLQALTEELEKNPERFIDKSTGKINDSAVREFIIDYIKKHAASFVPSSGAEASGTLEELWYSYQEALANKDLEKLRQSAASYCAKVMQLGGKYAEAAEELFGANFGESISSMGINDITSKMNALKDKVDAINKEIAEAEQKAKEAAERKAAYQGASSALDNTANAHTSAIINGNSEIHTEFGIEENGNIVFQEESTTKVFNILWLYVMTDLGNDRIKQLGGSDAVRKLVQAAWIMTYNTFNSSQKNSAANFVRTVINNLQSIIESIGEHPEYYDIYTKHTAYANRDLTIGLTHYGTNTTYGNDEIVKYDASGIVEKDKADYDVTMTDLLSRLKKAYSSIDAAIIEKVFKNAQAKALDIMNNRAFDCPYGTGNNHVDVYTRKSNGSRNWSGNDNRKGDDSGIKMQDLVELTLYCFDKLLYQELANAA